MRLVLFSLFSASISLRRIGTSMAVRGAWYDQPRISYNLGLVLPVEYVASRTGTRLLKLNGYTYYATQRAGKTRWRCSTHQWKGCNAAVVTFGNQVLYATGMHTHLPKEKQNLHYNCQIKIKDDRT
ncbi:unnamed protein product [Pieris macdunnoughi]|uniref:FLYWCH-type domain-containing protein n=1 Tax=Pieris macdunnoughi TaxID=345717 RepID=A0A821Q9Y8_9NEOP|nr:unnamed protein product [Pieris macdunnoughi]